MATFAAVALLMPQVGQAQNYNQIGIYSDMLGTPASANYAAVPNTAFNAYLVVTNPMNDSFNGGTGTAQPITSIRGFDCTVKFPAGVTVLSTTMPPQAISIGVAPEYIVGLATGVPVVNNAAVLCTWQLMVPDSAEYDVTMGTVRQASLPGMTSIVDGDDPMDPVSPTYVSTNDYSVPVFSINGNAAVPVDAASWGDVKALFR